MDIIARCAFKEKITASQNANQTIIYLEESGFADDMPRQQGYATLWEGRTLHGSTKQTGTLKVVLMSLEPYSLPACYGLYKAIIKCIPTEEMVFFVVGGDNHKKVREYANILMENFQVPFENSGSD